MLFAFILEWLLRLTMFVGSALQLIFVMGQAVAYCAFSVGALEMERTWMLLLAITQVIMATTFSVWKIQLIRKAALERQEKSELMLDGSIESSFSRSTEN